MTIPPKQDPNLWTTVPPVPGQSAQQSYGCKLEAVGAKTEPTSHFFTHLYIDRMQKLHVFETLNSKQEKDAVGQEKYAARQRKDAVRLAGKDAIGNGE